MQRMWDDRYRLSMEHVHGSEPNRLLKEVASDLETGTALDLGCGQGRNALWLASRGLEVTGLDLSPVAVAQANERAIKSGLNARFETVNLVEWDPEGRTWDLVLLAYLHLPADARRVVHTAAAAAVAPGGRLVAIAHHLDNLNSGTGGPSNPEWLFTEAQLAEDFAALTIVRNERVVLPTENGDAFEVVCVAVN